MILAGDIGGTKVHLALYNFAHGRLQPVRDQKFPAHQYSGLEAIVNEFLSSNSVIPSAVDGSAVKPSQIFAACFGCPGPVIAGKLKLTNLPWELDSRVLSKSLGIEHVFLINDLQANGYGIPEVAPDKIFTLHAGDATAIGNRALVSAGTGLGEGLLIWNGKFHQPIPSEGGHADFAARTDIEIELLNYLRRTLNGHVSWERVVSGLGIKNIYSFLRDAKKIEEPKWLRDRMAAEDPNAVIGECAENGSSDLCTQTLEIFVSAYGAEAGNMGLKVLATGGVYLGGGIAPKILKTMQNGSFVSAFTDKGRLSKLVEAMPVRIILDEGCALLGAAAYAEARAADFSGHSERAASVQFS